MTIVVRRKKRYEEEPWTAREPWNLEIVLRNQNSPTISCGQRSEHIAAATVATYKQRRRGDEVLLLSTWLGMPSDKLAKLCQEVDKGEARNTSLWVDLDREKFLLESKAREPNFHFADHKCCPGPEVNIYFSLSDDNTKRIAPGVPDPLCDVQ